MDHEIRLWINDPQEGISTVKSAIYYHIWELFKENNIVIPFPQRDIHLKAEHCTALTRGLQQGGLR